MIFIKKMQENHSVIILILGYLTYCDFIPDFSLKKWNHRTPLDDSDPAQTRLRSDI